MSSGLRSLELIGKLLSEVGLREVVTVRRGVPPVDAILVVPASKLSARAGKNVTSRRQLEQAITRIRDRLDLQAEWITTQDAEHAAIEGGLFALIKKRFGDIFSSCFLSGDGDRGIVWIEVLPKFSAPNLDEVAPVISEFLKLYGIQTTELVYGDDHRLPSQPALLRRIKLISPCRLQTIANSITESFGVEVELRWLERKLDTLRRQGLLIRSQDGIYSLAERGLHLVPFSRTRVSSDIERILALAKRKW